MCRNRIVNVALLAMAVQLVGQTALAIPLSDLLAGQSIVVLDKTFTNFSNFNSGASGANASPIDPAFIDVSGTIVGGEIGLVFTDDPATPQLQIGAQSGQGTVFEYDVITAGPWIHDNTLILGPGAAVASSIVGSNSGILVQEQVTDLNNSQLAFKEVFMQFINGVQSMQLIDHKVFAPQPQIVVNVDIGLITDPNDPGGSAGMVSFTQTFSQVPEPSTLALGLLGLVSLLAYARRRR